MQFQKKEKRQTTVRFDSHHVRLRTGEVQRKTGSYMYRWTDKLGKTNKGGYLFKRKSVRTVRLHFYLKSNDLFINRYVGV